MARDHEGTELSDYLSDQPPAAFKNQLSAPIAWRMERLLSLLKTSDSARDLGTVSAAELISALLHAQRPDVSDLAKKVVAYRKARVWETRESAGEITKTTGPWRIRLRGPGEKY